MNRKEKLLTGVDVANQVGLEFGALVSPIISRKEGRIYYVDHLSTKELKEKYKIDPNIDPDKIVDVDFVYKGGSLRKAVGKKLSFDYAVASHVIEHVPDVVGWLRSIAEVLKPGGKLCLIVPDKRYTFDILRQNSTCSDLIEAYMQKLERPSLKHIFDHFSMVAHVDVARAWKGELSPGSLQKFSESPVHAFKACENVFKTGKYIDCHCYVFTPQSFFEIIRTLIPLDLFDYKLSAFYPTEPNQNEFVVIFEKMPAMKNIEKKRKQQLASLPKLGEMPDMGELVFQNQELRQQLEKVSRSLSWKVTGPLRNARTLLHRVKRRLGA